MPALHWIPRIFLFFCAVTGCNRGDSAVEPNPEPTPAPPAVSTGTGSAATPPAPEPPATSQGFVQGTLRQEELRGIALSALDRGNINLGIAALIALMETAEMSDLKASGVLLLGQLYHNEGDSDRALAILQNLIASAPPMAEFEFTVGRTLNELGRPAEAIAHLQRAIELNPEFLQSYIHLGSVLVAEGREPEAEPVFLAYEQALAGLLGRLTDAEQPIQARLYAADLLGMANPDSRITAALVGLLQEDSVVMQGTAIQLLAQIGTPDAVPALEAYAGRAQHEELRAAAGQAAQHLATHAH